jgi:hypothetical protein
MREMGSKRKGARRMRHPGRPRGRSGIVFRIGERIAMF